MTVTLRNPETSDIKVIPDGWCWSCFLFSGFLGLPLFRRGLQAWGSAMVVFNIVVLIVALVPTERAETLYGWLSAVGLGLCAFLGLRANQMAIDRHLALGWHTVERGAPVAVGGIRPRSPRSGLRAGAIRRRLDSMAPSSYRAAAMRYRIEVSPTRKGLARVNLPGRVVALEARRHAGPLWLVGVSDANSGGAGEDGAVTVRADSAGDAVWRVAQATIRAVAELTDSPLDGIITQGFSDRNSDNPP